MTFNDKPATDLNPYRTATGPACADTPTSTGGGMARRIGAWTASVLIALVPLSLAVEFHLKALVPGLLFIAGLVVLVADPRVRRCVRGTWPVFATALAAIVIAIANVLVHGLGWRPLDQPGHILLFVVIAATFGLRLQLRVVWTGLALTGAVLGGVCIWQHHVLGIARPFGLNGGKSAAIEMAILLLALALVALTRMLREEVRLPSRVFFGACAALAAYGALLTQSRGPLLAFVPAFALVVLTYARRSRHWRRGTLVVGVSLLGAVLLGVTMRAELTHRFDAVGHEITALQQGRDTNGSIGKRLEMWAVAARAFREHPLMGIGLDQYNHFVRAEVAAGRAWPSIAKYNQPHNAYLDAAAGGGLLSLGALIMLLLMPLRHFARHLRSADSETAAAAIGGAAVVVLYAFGSLGEGVFFRVMSLSLYFFLVLGLVVLTEARTRAASGHR